MPVWGGGHGPAVGRGLNGPGAPARGLIALAVGGAGTRKSRLEYETAVTCFCWGWRVVSKAAGSRGPLRVGKERRSGEIRDEQSQEREMEDS